MAVQPITIYQSTVAVPGVKTTVYAVPNGARVRIDYCGFTNIDYTNSEQLSVWVGPLATVQRIKSKTILPLECYLCPEVVGVLLKEGDVIALDSDGLGLIWGSINGVIFT